MGKARLDTCLSSSSSPKLITQISDDSIYKALKSHVWYRGVSKHGIGNKRTVVGLSIGLPSLYSKKKRDRFLVIRIVY